MNRDVETGHRYFLMHRYRISIFRREYSAFIELLGLTRKPPYGNCNSNSGSSDIVALTDPIMDHFSPFYSHLHLEA